MANKRQKKKKNSQAARQAAAAYKGKNAPVTRVAPVKKEEPKPAAVQEQLAENQVQKPESAKLPEKKSVEVPVEKSKKTNDKKVEKKPVKKAKNPKKKNRNKITFAKLKLKAKEKIEKIGIRKFAAIVLAVSLVIAAVCIIAWITVSHFSVPDEAIVKYAGRDLPNTSTHIVTDDLVTQYEFADKLKRKGDKELFRYYANQSIVFEQKYSSATLNLVNVFDNNCVIIASIVDEADNVIFQSLGLPAGRCLPDIEISDLDYGTHDMKLVVSAYDPETYEFIGVQYSDLTVQVGIEEETSNAQENESENSK